MHCNLVSFVPAKVFVAAVAISAASLSSLAQDCPHREYAWTHTVGGELWDLVQGNGIVIDRNDRVLIVGQFSLKVDFDPGDGKDNRRSKGSSDGYVSWYGLDGGYGGTYTFGVKRDSDLKFNSVLAVDARPAGGFAIAGDFEGKTDFDPTGGRDSRRNMGDSDGFVTAFHDDLSYDWTWTVGGTGRVSIWGVKVDSSGSIIATGEFSGRMFVGNGEPREEVVSHGSRDVFVVKLSTAGEFQWVAAFGGPEEDRPWAVTTDSEGNAFVVGQFRGEVDFEPGEGEDIWISNGDSDLFVLKLSPQGQLAWCKTIGGAGTDLAYTVLAAPSDHVYVGGVFSKAVDFDPEGGGDIHDSGQALGHAFVTQYAGDGSYIWTRSFGGETAGAYVHGMAQDGNRLLLTGGYFGTVDLDPGEGVDERQAFGGRSCYVAYWTPDGVYRQGDVFGGEGRDRAQGVATDRQGSVYVAGDFNSAAVDFDPTIGVAERQCRGSADIYLSKFYCGSCDYVERHDLEYLDGVLRSTAYLLAPGGRATVVVSGAEGKFKKSKSVDSDGLVRIAFSDLPPGDYVASIRRLRDTGGTDLCKGRIAERRIVVP